ncbi:MAG: amidase [Oligoflexia bacterium]|nr:MAG: amidase [Oligoflexia bacterium]
MNKILEYSALELANKIKSSELSSVEVVKAHIDQIEKVNPALNAVVEKCYDEALKEAELIDSKKSGHDHSPLTGVPFTMKEMFTVKGLHHTLGSIHKKDQMASADATVVSRLKEAGAILIGTTNVAELGFWFECSNKVYGQTNNPHDLGRTSGGSTGGEGAIIGAGGSPFGIGSDIGGSIRMPAAFCGIFGHKSTHKLVPMTGHPPIYPGEAEKYAGKEYPMTAAGPMCRRATDLLPILNIIKGRDFIDPETVEHEFPPALANHKKLKVYILKNPTIKGTSKTEPCLQEACEKVGKYFEQIGSHVEELDQKIFFNAFQNWSARMAEVDIRTFEEALNPNEKINYFSEFTKFFFGQANYTFPSLVSGLLERNMDKNSLFFREQRKKSLQELSEIQNRLEKILGSNGIIVMPTHPKRAPRHHAPILTPFDFIYTGVINALGFPATTVPVGRADGLPLAVQIVGAPFQDHLTISIAEHLEQVFGGWVKPAEEN